MIIMNKKQNIKSWSTTAAVVTGGLVIGGAFNWAAATAPNAGPEILAMLAPLTGLTTALAGVCTRCATRPTKSKKSIEESESTPS